jgi:hypothetical protein
MSKISTYTNAPSPISGSDKLIGTETGGLVDNATKNFTVTELQTFIFKNGNSLLSFANNAAAISGGLVAGNIYRTSTGEIRIVF